MRDLSLIVIGRVGLAMLAAKRPVSEAKVAPYRDGDATSLTNALLLLCKSNARSTRVVVDDSLIKLFTVDPPRGLTRFSELKAVAEVRFEELFGVDSADWRLSGEWSARNLFVACAAPHWLLQAIEAGGVQPARIEPAFVDCHNAIASSEPLQWLLCRYSNTVTAACFNGSACEFIRSSTLEAEECSVAWLEREALLSARPINRVALATPDAASNEGIGRSFEVRRLQPPVGMQLLQALPVNESETA